VRKAKARAYPKKEAPYVENCTDRLLASPAVIQEAWKNAKDKQSSLFVGTSEENVLYQWHQTKCILKKYNRLANVATFYTLSVLNSKKGTKDVTARILQLLEGLQVIRRPVPQEGYKWSGINLVSVL